MPPFAVGSVVFTCFVCRDQEGSPYVWRSGCRRAAVGRRIVLRMVADGEGGEVERAQAFAWARVDARLLGADYGSLGTAMAAASMVLVSGATGELAA